MESGSPQPLAVFLRPVDGRSLHWRCGAERTRRNRRVSCPQRWPTGQLWLAADGRAALLQSHHKLQSGRAHPTGPRLLPCRRSLFSYGRVCVPGLGGAGAARHLFLRRFLRWFRSELSLPERPGDEPIHMASSQPELDHELWGRCPRGTLLHDPKRESVQDCPALNGTVIYSCRSTGKGG